MNPWKQFVSLLPKSPQVVGEVLALNGDGTALIQMLGGGQLQAVGSEVPVGARCYVKDGRVIGTAPAIPITHIDI